jgi:hypothetical protein
VEVLPCEVLPAIWVDKCIPYLLQVSLGRAHLHEGPHRKEVGHCIARRSISLGIETISVPFSVQEGSGPWPLQLTT